MAVYYIAIENKCKVSCVLWYHSHRRWYARPNIYPHSGYSGISKKRPSNSICLYSYCLYLFLFFYWQLSWIVFVFCFLAKLFHIYMEHIFDICVYKITVPFLCSKHYDKCFVGLVKSSQQPCCTVEITKAWSRLEFSQSLTQRSSSGLVKSVNWELGIHVATVIFLTFILKMFRCQN